MSAINKIEQDNVMSFATLTEFDYKQLRSFEDILVSSIQAAEELWQQPKTGMLFFHECYRAWKNKTVLPLPS